MLRQLFYLSRADAAITEQSVTQILRVAQRNNRQRDITGCLLYSGEHFAQVLEGEAAALEDVLVRIRSDARHYGLVVAVDQEVVARKFPNWSMALLYKLDMSDRLEALLAGEKLSRDAALALFNDVEPDSVMGSL